jgi:hypothetical protein
LMAATVLRERSGRSRRRVPRERPSRVAKAFGAKAFGAKAFGVRAGVAKGAVARGAVVRAADVGADVGMVGAVIVVGVSARRSLLSRTLERRTSCVPLSRAIRPAMKRCWTLRRARAMAKRLAKGLRELMADAAGVVVVDADGVMAETLRRRLVAVRLATVEAMGSWRARRSLLRVILMLRVSRLPSEEPKRVHRGRLRLDASASVGTLMLREIAHRGKVAASAVVVIEVGVVSAADAENARMQVGKMQVGKMQVGMTRCASGLLHVAHGRVRHMTR